MKAIVTGSSKGLGFAFASALLQKGYKVAISARNQAGIDDAISKLKTISDKVIGHQLDYSDSDAVKNYVNEILSDFGQIDILINNVGMYSVDQIDDDIEETLAKNININLMSAVRINDAVVKQMKSQKNGLIINVVSIAAKDLREDSASYSISKLAFSGYTDLLRKKLRKDNIKVVGLYPGAMKTASWDDEDVNKSKLIQMSDMKSVLNSILELTKNSNMDELVINTVEEI